MRGLKTDRTSQVAIAGHAFVQNLRRGHYDIALDTPPATRLAAAFAGLARAIWPAAAEEFVALAEQTMQRSLSGLGDRLRRRSLPVERIDARPGQQGTGPGRASGHAG